MPSTELAADLGHVLLGDLAPGGQEIVAADPIAAWASSGGLWLTGDPAGPPMASGAGAGAVAEHLLRIVGQLIEERGVTAGLPSVAVLGERAALAGLTRQGAASCGGASRILATADGHVVLTLARDEDLALVPALVADGPPSSGLPWDDAAGWASRSTTEAAAARIDLLGLPGGAVGESDRPGVAVRTHAGSRRVVRERPRVLDLSSMWAGPLCAHLLGLAGADVVKVESTRRLDGARRGNRAFYDLLHAGHRSVVLDFADRGDLDRLRRLAEIADVVIEGSRPRALARLGLIAEDLVSSGGTWVSVTAHGRDPEGAHRVGFGDDVAAGAGLVGEGPVFVGDAIADPLTGLAAAAAALSSLRSPRGHLLDVAMDRVAGVAGSIAVDCAVASDGRGGWVVEGERGVHPVARPRARQPRGPSRAPGSDTAEVVSEWSS